MTHYCQYYLNSSLDYWLQHCMCTYISTTHCRPFCIWCLQNIMQRKVEGDSGCVKWLLHNGIASYGAVGHVPPSTSNCLIFHVTSEWHKLWHTIACGFSYAVKNLQTYSFVYCMNFTIFLYVVLKLLLSVQCTA